MAFDINTARPEGSTQPVKSGFDINTAKPEKDINNVNTTNNINTMGRTSNIQPVSDQAQNDSGGFIAGAKDMITGDSQQTKEIAGLGEIGNAPELNEFSMRSFKTALGLLATGDEEKAIGVIKQNIPNSEFSKDSKGNTIVTMPSGKYLLNSPGLSGQDIMRFTAQALAFTPASRVASLAGAGLAAGATELGIQAGASQLGGGDISGKDVALATGLGVGGKAIENVLSAGTRMVKGSIPKDKAEIIKTGEDLGVPVLTTDVVQPDTLVGKLARSSGETIPLAGTGGARSGQQKGREQVAESFAENVTPRYAEVIESLKSKTSAIKRAAGNRLSDISSKMDDAGQVPTTSTIKAIDDEIQALSASGRVPDDATINTLTKYRQALNEGQSFSSLDTLRSDFREAVKGERMVLPTRSNAAMNKIYSGMTNDLKSSIDDTLGTISSSKWTQAKGIYGAELELLKKTKLKTVLDKGDITPESVKNMIFSQKPSEMKVLYRSLNNSGRSATRATIIDEIVRRASRGVGGLSPNSLATELKKAGPQIDVFFKARDKAQLIGLKNFMNATRRSQDAVVATPTGQSLAGLIAGGGIVANPTVTIPALATVGGLARVYESALVRNSMLKLSSLTKGTDAFDKAVIETTKAVTTAAQALKPKEDN
jgi:hypothetical protein